MKIESIQQVSVLGLGTMGCGIVQAFAMAGFSVRAYDEVAEARQSTLERIRLSLTDFVKAEIILVQQIEPILARIKIVDREEDAVRGSQFITEAVREDLTVKQELFERLEKLVPADTIFASNSSTFPISQSGAGLKNPGRALITHYFNPPQIIPTVEIVPGPLTSEENVRTTLEIMRRMGKEAIRVNREIPGFIVNRIQIAVARELWNLLDQGVASAEDIDSAIRGSMGFRLALLGPLEVHDFGGLDIFSAVYKNIAPTLKSDAEIPAVVQKLVSAGNYGAKTGKGFYTYTPEKLAKKRMARDESFLKLFKHFFGRNRNEKSSSLR